MGLLPQLDIDCLVERLESLIHELPLAYYLSTEDEATAAESVVCTAEGDWRLGVVVRHVDVQAAVEKYRTHVRWCRGRRIRVGRCTECR